MSSIIKNFFIYSASALLLRGASVVVAPLTLQLLSPSEYGLVALIHSFSSITTILIGFGLRQLLSIEFFHYTGAEQRTLINHILAVYCMVATPLFLCALAGCATINRYIFAHTATNSLISITLIYCYIFFFVELLYQILRYQEKVRLVTWLQTSSALGIICLNVLLLAWYRAGVYSAITSYCISYGAVCVWGAYRYRHYYAQTADTLRTSLQHLPYYLRMGLPFIPTVLCSWVLSSSDRWLLARMTTLHDVGIYSLADAFGQLYLLVILQPISNAYLPRLMRLFKTDENLVAVEQNNRKNTLYGMLIAASIISAGYCICRPLVILLLPNRYHQAVGYIWYILMGYVLLTGTYCFSALIQFCKCRWFLSFSLILPALCNILLNALLIPTWGLHGCVMATLIAQAIYCVTTYWYGSRLLKGLASESYKTRQDLAHSPVHRPHHVPVAAAQKVP